jgi:hypothetical protein
MPRCGESESSRHLVKWKGTGADFADLTSALVVVKKLETSVTALDTAPHIITKATIKKIQHWWKFGHRALPLFKEDRDQRGNPPTCYERAG